jgi:hypothetical protein
LRCQAMTVSGLTIFNDERQSAHTRDSQMHRSRSAACNCGRLLPERRRTPIWCRSATFSNRSAARVLNTDEAPARKRANHSEIDRRTLRIRSSSHHLSSFRVFERDDPLPHQPENLLGGQWTHNTGESSSGEKTRRARSMTCEGKRRL